MRPDDPHPSAGDGWHAQPADAVLATLGAARTGLSAAEAAARRARHGPNLLPQPPRRSALARFGAQFRNVLIYVLLASGVVTALLGELVDSAVIVGVVVINAIIGYLQEGKAEAALDAIRDMLPLRAQVLRDGHRREIAAEDLVPGDIVFVASGDKVPADLRLLELSNLRIAEDALTGESVAVEKQVRPVPAASELGDRLSMAYSSTLVTYGQGMGVVTATGAATEIGRIGTMLAALPELTTPLLRKLAAFGGQLTWVTLAVAAAMFLFGIAVRGYPAHDMFMAAVGLAVAAIPEGLPAIMTITLAIGVQRMARRHAIIRRLPAVEALGSVTVICTDKTGTLTKNEMTAQVAIAADATFEVTGAGYAPHGGFERDGRAATPAEHPVLSDLGRAALLCNDAALRQENGRWLLTGDPTEGALVTLGMKAGLDPGFEREALPRTDVIPFESEHRFMATLHHDHAGRGVVFLKGAPERVLELCSRQREAAGDRPLDSAHWMGAMDLAAAQGMRLLALALREDDGRKPELEFTDVESGGFTLLAVLGIADPPKDEAMHAVAACRAAGIRVKMITGDHAATAGAIGRRLGLSENVSTVTGASLDALDDEALRRVALEADVFARASPEHKLRLVRALQAQGEIVAMTGDGVNDAPALKMADVGVAMGGKGTEAAKEAAEIVLADDNFASIAAAVEEGRAVYDNLRKAILFALPTNVGQGLMVLMAVLLGVTVPITPVQILWVNMVTAVTLALAIAFEEPEGRIMHMPPRDPAEPLVTRLLAWRLLAVGAMLVTGAFGMFFWELERGVAVDAARTAAINTLVAGEIMYLFNCRHLTAPVLNREGLFGNRYVLIAAGVMVVLQLLFTYLPPMQAMFGTAAIDGDSWLRIVVFGVLLMLAVEAEKALLRRAAPGTGTA